MLIVQQNCDKEYEHTITTLEAALQLKTDIVCLQEFFIERRNLIHAIFSQYWSEDSRIEARVMIAIRKNILNRMMMNNRTDLIAHSYFLTINVRKINSRIKRSDRRTRVMNAYDIIIEVDHIWQRFSSRVRRALQDMKWQATLQRRMLLIDDLNAHSQVWNSECERRLNAAQLKNLIEKHDLLINNESRRFTRLASRAIIDLALITVELGPLTLWNIFENYSSSFDHELILLKWENQIRSVDQKDVETFTDWDVQALTKDSKQLKLIKNFWQQRSKSRSLSTIDCIQKKLNAKIEWVKTHLADTLTKYIKIIRIISFSKRWWNEEMKQTRKILSAAKRRWKKYIRDGNQRLREVRNQYYRVIRKAKKQCWQFFLQDDAEVIFDRIQQEDTNKCWTTLRFINSRTQITISALKRSDEITAIIMKNKETLIRATAFSKPSQSASRTRRIERSVTHQSITEKAIHRTLYEQAIKKASDSDKLIFKILRLLWEWNAERVERLIKHSIRLQYHFKRWKLTRKVLLKKSNKLSTVYQTLKSYRVISLLNCLRKIVKKTVTKELTMICEAELKLHKRQMSVRKKRCAINVVVAMLHKMQKIWSRKRLAEALFMNVKEAFDHVNSDKLICRMQEMKIDDDLIDWIKFFLTDRRVKLVIDECINLKKTVNTKISQESSVSSILFLIYLSEMFTEIKKATSEIIFLFFVNDLRFIVEEEFVAKIAVTLEIVNKAVIQWNLKNAINYDVNKTKAVLFIKVKVINRRRMIRSSKFKIEIKKIFLNEETTRWLRMFIDFDLQLKAHSEHRMKKAKVAKTRLREIVNTHELASELIRRIQIAAIQTTALYDAELWWKRQAKQKRKMQKLMNRQVRAITEMFRSTSEVLIIRETNLTSAKTLLNIRQREYEERLLSLSDDHLIKKILSIFLRRDDDAAQLKEQSIDDIDWAEERDQNTLSHYLARQLTAQSVIDLAEEMKSIVKIRSKSYSRVIVISLTERALEETREPRLDLVLWSDESRLEHERVEIAAAWRQKSIWQTCKTSLEKSKEIFDAKLWEISDALKVALNIARNQKAIIIFLDS